MKPSVSVVIVNDYAAFEEKSWDFTRETLRALAKQDFKEPAEFIFVESSSLKERIPEELSRVLPGLMVVLSEGDSAYHLMNVGVKQATAEIVVTLGGDCRPESEWLRHLVTAVRAHPEASVVTGPSVYGDQSLLIRALCLLERSYVDPGTTGYARFFEECNAGYPRSFLLSHPFSEELGVFSGRCRMEGIRQEKHKIWYEPKTKVTHVFHGWGFEKDLRRHCGRACFLTRRLEPRIRLSWLTKLGFFSIPFFLLARLGMDWWRCLKLWQRWNLRFFELPIALALAVLVRPLEIPGLIDGARGRLTKNSRYR